MVDEMFDTGKSPDGCGSGHETVAYLYGELCDEDSKLFEDHLAECPECSDELASFSLLRLSLAEIGNSEIAEVHEKHGLLARLSELLSAYPRLITRGLAGAAALALIIAAAVFFGIISGTGSDENISANTGQGTGTNDIEQAESELASKPDSAQNGEFEKNAEPAASPNVDEKARNELQIAKENVSGVKKAPKKSHRRSTRKTVPANQMAENQEAPRLSEAADEDFDDDSLRLTDLFAEVSKED